MKKITFFSCVLFAFSFCGLSAPFSLQLFSMFPDAKVCFYSSNYAQDNLHSTKIKNGTGAIFETQGMYAEELSNSITDITGFSLHFIDKENKVRLLLKQISIAKTEILNNTEIFYGYAIGLMEHIYLENKKVNIQIAINDNNVVIGSPIILGSY